MFLSYHERGRAFLSYVLEMSVRRAEMSPLLSGKGEEVCRQVGG